LAFHSGIRSGWLAPSAPCLY